MSRRFLLYTLLLLMVLESNVFAEGSPVAGIITRVRGQVTARKTGDETAAALKVGDRIRVGHIVASAKDSGVQIVFTDDSFVNVLPGTTLIIKQYEYSADDGRRSAVIKVSDGRARFVIYKITSRQSRFAVETGHALVSAGISDFFVSASPSETEIVNIGQQLSVKNVSYLTVGEVGLGPNQKSILKEKTPPSQPATVTPEQRRKYLKDAEI
jgi:hypothetical protein